MDGEKVVLLGAVAIGGYFLYENFFANALPADAVYVGQIPVGSLYAVPQSFSGNTPAAGPATTAIAYAFYGPAESAYYLTYTAPTAAQAAAATPTPAPAAGSTAVISPTAGTPAAPVSTPPAAPPGGIAAIWAKAIAEAAGDATYIANNGLMSGSQWNFYLSYVQPTAPAGYTGPQWPPEVPNTSAPLSAAAYWALLQPELTNYGLSGCGMGQCDDGLSGLLWLLLGGALTVGIIAWAEGRAR